MTEDRGFPFRTDRQVHVILSATFTSHFIRESRPILVGDAKKPQNAVSAVDIKATTTMMTSCDVMSCDVTHAQRISTLTIDYQASE